MQGVVGVPITNRRHSQWYTISFTSVADIGIFSSWLIVRGIHRAILEKRILFSTDILEEAADVDPDDQLVPLLLLLLDLLLDDPEDGRILIAAGGGGIVNIALFKG